MLQPCRRKNRVTVSELAGEPHELFPLIGSRLRRPVVYSSTPFQILTRH